MWLFDRVLMMAVVVCACTAASSSLPAVEINDTYFSHQWYSTTTGITNAWSISQGSSTVVVAVLDSGVISTTPDLAGPRLLAPLSAVPGQDPFTDAWLSDTSNSNYSIRRHGTWVASAIAMGINNGMGGAGVGNFSILPIRITNSSIYTQDSYIVNGIYMAADNGAKVINISYDATNFAALETAAEYARSKGALTFIAAGNDNAYRNIADYPDLIFVSGTDQNDQRWTSGGGLGSSWGSYVDIAAPAKDILLADPTLSPNGYGKNSGTSFAAPLAAGAAALAWSINPNLTPDQVEQMLYQTAVTLTAEHPGSTPGQTDDFGHGRINVDALAQAALATVPEPAAWIMLFTGAAAILCLRKKGCRI